MSERNTICARMPSGSFAETWANCLTIKGKSTSAMVVQCTEDHEVVDKPNYADFDRGFKKNELGCYLPKRMLWVFKRTSVDTREFRLLFQEWFVTHLSGNVKACIKMFQEMEEAPNRKEARKVRNKYYRIYGSWQFGLKKETKTKGLKNLMERKDDFGIDPESEGYKPRIAWRL